MIIKRIISLIIDVLLISIIVSGINSIKFINPDFDQYQDLSNNIIKKLQSNEIDDNFYKDIIYETNYYNKRGTIISVICYILYFALFPIFTNGQTLGKKLTHLKIVSENEKQVSFFQYLIRMIILYGVYLNIIVIILFIINVDKNIFVNIYSVLSFVNIVMFYIILIGVIFTKKHRGLHEVVSKTKVIQI